MELLSPAESLRLVRAAATPRKLQGPETDTVGKETDDETLKTRRNWSWACSQHRLDLAAVEGASYWNK